MQGRLLLGLPVDGKRYFDFEVNLLTLGGECKALEMVDELGIDLKEEEPNRADKLLIDLAYLCQQVTFIGVDEKQITPRYLLEHLATDDYVLLTKSIGELRKKHIVDGGNLNQADSDSAHDMT